MKISRLRRAAPLAAITVIIAAIAAAAPSAAVAATGSAAVAPAASNETGWLRLGHLSPDTKAVDVRVSALRGGTVVFKLSDVGYGDVSAYTPLPDGDYAISMIASGSNDWTNLALAGTVSVHAATATTVAAYGPSTGLQTAVASPTTSPRRARAKRGSASSRHPPSRPPST